MEQRRNERGFTLVELMLVVVILGILAAVVLPNLAGKSQQARVGATKSQIQVFETALNSFELDTGAYPTNEQGLTALVSDPGLDGWSGPYLQKKSVPKDQWGNPFVYNVDGEHSVNYDLYSPGPDKQENTDDDIGNWDEEDTQ